MLRVMVGPEILNEAVINAYPVRRALDVFAIGDKIGDVLAHSAVILTTKICPVLVEYMNDSHVYITYCKGFKEGDMYFKQKKYMFILDRVKGQEPIDKYDDAFKSAQKNEVLDTTSYDPKNNNVVTVKRFADKMCEIMKNKTFNVITHNCHDARLQTMDYFGMKSGDIYNRSQNQLLITKVVHDLRRKNKLV